MLKILQITNEKESSDCDNLLTKLIQAERSYDKNIKTTFTVKENYKNKIKEDYNALFIAYYNNNPVGFIYGYLKGESGSFVINSVVKVSALYVEENYRNKGIAKELMNEFYNWCKKKNIKIVEIGVFKNNKKALNLYEKQGFEKNVYYLIKSL